MWRDVCCIEVAYTTAHPSTTMSWPCVTCLSTSPLQFCSLKPSPTCSSPQFYLLTSFPFSNSAIFLGFCYRAILSIFPICSSLLSFCSISFHLSPFLRLLSADDPDGAGGRENRRAKQREFFLIGMMEGGTCGRRGAEMGWLCTILTSQDGAHIRSEKEAEILRGCNRKGEWECVLRPLRDKNFLGSSIDS